MTTPFDLSITDKLLSTTRAVRHRLDFSRPVERDVIMDCIDLAQQAPTASNTQTWRWIVVTDPAKRGQIGEVYRSGKAAMAASRERQVGDDEQTRRVYDAAQYLLQHIDEVPVLVIPCVEGRPPPGTDHCTVSTIFGSIYPSVWNFQLALRSRGLGSVLTTIHLLREQEVADILGIPEHVMQVALLPVAYTRGVDFKPAKRQPPENITHWNAW